MEQKETLCKVCGDKASGKHYGVPSCDGCRGFFKRSIRRGLAYHCKESGSCVVDVTRRNQCQACRFKKCLAVNMKRDGRFISSEIFPTLERRQTQEAAVQHERAPRTTLASSHCPTVPGVRRHHGYGYPAHGTFFAPPGPIIDLPAYHLIYPQPTFPFHLGIKSPGLGLPSSLGLGILNCPNPLSTPTTFKPTPEILQSHSYYPIFRSCRRNVPVEDSTQPTSISSAEEDEVTSSEEAKDVQFCFYDPLSAKPHFLDLTIPQGTENIYESAAKLLFLTVKWARSIPSFLQLSFQDQSILMKNSWSELFVLSAAQWALPINEEYLVNDVAPSDSNKEILEKEARKLKETISKFISLKVDHTEYTYLKALTLFKSESTSLKDRSQVEMLQDQTHIMLHDYCTSQDSHKARFGKLLMLLPSVNVLSKDLIEELLFRKTIGNISIERVLSDMLKNSYHT